MKLPKHKKSKHKGAGPIEYGLALLITTFIGTLLIMRGLGFEKKHEPIKPTTCVTTPKAASPVTEDTRKDTLKSFLKRYNASLSDYTEDFIRYADQYGIDYRIVPAIAGVESSFCKRYPKTTNNCFGYMAPSGGLLSFDSIDLGIRKVAWTIATRPQYSDWRKQQSNIKALAAVYNEGNEKKWEADVEYFIQEIK